MENFCTYCSVIVGSEAELRAHCNSQGHQLTIMSDEGREWKHRAPPRGVGADQYNICLAFAITSKCRFGQQCCDAHGEEELNEWKERFDYRQLKLQRAKESKLQGRHYSEQLLEKWLTSPNPNHIMADTLDDVELVVEPDINLAVSEKNCCREWIFRLSAKSTLRHIALLYETHRNHFRISQVMSGRASDIKEYNLGPHCQEWSNPDNSDYSGDHYTIKVRFVTAIYGTFRQAVVFDFGFEPVLVQKLCVDVVSVSDMEKLQQAREIAISFTERWSNDDVTIVPFENRPYALDEKEECLLSCYPAPNGSKFTLTQSVMEPTLTKNNYCARQHELLCIEEMTQYELLSRYNVQAQLNLTSCYLLTPNSAVTAKYAHNGELFANMQLSSVLSEDSSSGRLILTNCNTVLLAPVKTKGQENRKVYEAIIEDKGKTVIYIRLSKRCCEELKLKADKELLAEVQFQLNRLPLCEMHFAIDRLHPPSLVFPDVTIVPQLWNPNTKWNYNVDPRLNPKQKEAVQAITTPLSIRLPPVLIIGPFGTGKTFTLAQAVQLILDDPLSRILVCTHSNSAADIYIREYLHPQVAEGRIEATPLRIYYRHRWVATVHPTVQQYCLVSTAGTDRTFNMPTVDDVKKHKVIVTTLSTSRYLVQLGLEKGFFTHILIDEAAQAMECEVIMPLSLANETTRIVLAGDHMQLSPEVYSQFAQERNLHTSLLERLYDLYPEDYACKVLLCENYRSHEAIIKYTSELFYDNHLQASGQQPRHEKYYPLTFFTARGEDIQDCNSTAFHNNAEVYEIVERVIELKKNWPKSWGEQDETSVGVVTPYYDQVVRIRAELRKKKLHGVSVERVLNVQGKQFRVIFLSAVRTRQTCGLKSKPESELDHGFLSNARLLNTAITRAQSLVAVVGDPVSLCSIGKCRKLWEKFIFTCHKENSLFGITWDSLRSQLDSMELKKNFILNPLAPEFVPGRMYHGQPSTLSNEAFCPNTVPPQPWLLFPFASPFQGPPLLQPPMAHMLSAAHPYNMVNCLCPSLIPPPHQNHFQNFQYNSQPPTQRASNIPPRMPSTIFPRKISNNRNPPVVMESPFQMKEFDRNATNGRQIKRNETHQNFNIPSKPIYGRPLEERNQNDVEEMRKLPNRNEQHNNFTFTNEISENINNFQNAAFNIDEKKSYNFQKLDDLHVNLAKHNIQGNVDSNNLTPFNDQFLLNTNNKIPFTTPWYPLSSKAFPDSDSTTNILNNTSEAEHLFRVPFTEINGITNERERICNPTLHPIFNSNRVDLANVNIPAVHSSLKEKLGILEKALPPGTDISGFLESEEQTKGFLHHLISSKGVHAARAFLKLMLTIKKHQDYLRSHLINGFAQKRVINQRYSPIARNVSDSPSVMRNIPFSQFNLPRGNIDTNRSTENFIGEPFTLDNPSSPFNLPRIISVDKIESGFANQEPNRPEISRHQVNIGNHHSQWGTTNHIAPNNLFNRQNQDNLALEMAKLSLNNRMANGDVLPSEENIFSSHPFNARRSNEGNINQEAIWPPSEPKSTASESGFSQGSYLSRLRNISSSIANGDSDYVFPFDFPRSDERSPIKNEFQTSTHMTAGPLSMSYPDIPDILSSHILPNNKESSSKAIHKPNSRAENSNTNNAASFVFDISMPSNNGSSLRYPQLSSEGMTYAKILRSPQH